MSTGWRKPHTLRRVQNSAPTHRTYGCTIHHPNFRYLSTHLHNLTAPWASFQTFHSYTETHSMLQMLQTRPALIVIHAGRMPMDIPHYPLECSLSSACMAFAMGLRFSSHTNLQNTHSQSSRPVFRHLQRWSFMTTAASCMHTASTGNSILSEHPVPSWQVPLACGHIGCSKGYCLDSYKKIDTRGINSQVNEQANVGLKRIQSQLTYFFHVSLFLAIKNRDKIDKLDISRLHV